MQDLIDALKSIINSIKENQSDISIIVAILFILSIIVKVLQKTSSRRQQTQYEQSLQIVSIKHNLYENNLKDKIIDYAIKYIVIAALLVILVFALDYVAGLIWEE